MLPAVVALLLEIVGEFAQSVEVDPALVEHDLHDLLLAAQEVLEGTVLLHVAAARLVLLVLVQVHQVVWDLVEGNIVYEETAGHVKVRDVVMAVAVELVELVVPEGLDKFVAEVHVLFVCDLGLALEDPLAHADVDLEELGLLVLLQSVLLGEVGLQLMLTDAFGQFTDRHLATMLVEVLDNTLVWRLHNEHKEVELGERNLTVSIDIGDLHDIVNLLPVFLKVFTFVNGSLVVIRSQGIEEVLVRHGGIAFLVDSRGKLFVDLLWRTEESDLVFSIAFDVIFVRRLGGES